MRILLTTTGGNKNPGDQFIRIGVENLIKAVWPVGELPPTLIRVDKESDEIATPQTFDRAILCGMPLWWNNHISTSQSIGWWGPIFRGWLSENPRNLLVLGAGPVTGKDGIRDEFEFLQAVKESRDRAYAVTTRQILPIRVPGVLESLCPAAFAAHVPEGRQTRKLCNLMPEGAHDRHFDPEAAAEWKRRLPDVGQMLLQHGFEFVAHSQDEEDLAFQLGWPRACIHFPFTPEALLRLYSEAKILFSNRLHGAMVAAVSGATSVAVGYDSRMEMLRHFTPHRWSPFGVPARNLAEHLEGLAPQINRARLAAEYSRNCDIMRKFLFN